MSNSKLVDVKIISPNKSHPRSHKIDTITIHCMAGQMTAKACGQWFAKSSTRASSNYGVGSDGAVGLYVDEGDRSWASSNAANDNRAITIEVASDSKHPYKVKDGVYEVLIQLVADICGRNNIKKLLWKGDKNLIGQVSKQNMTVHRWFKDKACPGDYLYNKHTDIAKRVNKLLKTYDPADFQGSVLNVQDEDSEGTTGYTETVVYSNATNSSLATYINRLSSDSYTDRTGVINCITVHISKSTGSITDLAKLINSSKKSYTYGIANDGTIGMFVDEKYATTSTGNKYNDNRSVNIICVNSKLTSDYPISKDCYKSLVDLCEDICRRNFIFKLYYYKSTPQECTLTLHSQFNKSAGCPGSYVTKKISDLTKEVNDRLLDNSAWVTVTQRLASSETLALKAQSTVSLGAIKPLVARPNPDKLGVDYKALQQIGIVGVMLDAGAYYDKQHNVTEKYRNPNVYKQVEEVKKSSLPWGFYYTSRARDIEEAKTELYWFRFVVMQEPPKLGAWIRCDFDSSDTLTRSIVNYYYQTFIEWGLKSKCGICATLAQAKRIKWPTQCTYMPLWLEGSLDDRIILQEEVLTPSFFQLDDLENTGYNPSKAELIKNIELPTESSYIGDELVTELTEDYKIIKAPKDSKYTGTKKYEGYTAITSKTSLQYKLTRSSACKIDTNGFCRIEGRYLVAVGSGVCSAIGTYIDIELANHEIIHCIMGDMKADVHTDKKHHIYTVVNDNHCCSEFLVRSADLPTKVKSMGDCSYLTPKWQSPVVSFKVFKKNWFK